MSNEENTELIENIQTKKKKKVPLWAIIAITVAAAAAVVIFILNSMKYQSTDDAYVESHMIQIAPKVTGQITELYIKDNQKIKEGDIVAKIDDEDYIIRFNQADAEYKKALAGQNIALANLSAANSEIQTAETDLKRYEKLYESGAVSKQTLDNARTRLDGVKAKYRSADESVFSNGGNTVADENLKVLKAKRDKAELDLKNTKVIAPNNGTVTNKRAEKGAYAVTGSPLFVLVSDEVWIVANFKENQVGKMKEGQPVEIKIDTYPNKTFKGKIDSIQRASGAKSSLFPPENAVGSFVKIVQRIPVKIVFDEEINPEEFNIVAGMSVVPKVKIK